MAIREANQSMDEVIQNLKSLLSTLQSVNEGLTAKTDELKEDDESRQNLAGEMEQHVEDLTEGLKEYDQYTRSHLDPVEESHNQDFETGFSERIHNLADKYHEVVPDAISGVNEAHANMKAAHEQLIAAHDEYVQVEQEAVQVANTLSDETNGVYETIHAALEKAKEEQETDVTETRGGFTGIIGIISQATLNTSGIMDMITEAANTVLKESSEEAWNDLREQCGESATGFREWVDELSGESDSHGQEAIGGIGKLLQDVLRPPLDQLFEKAHDDNATSVMEELAELLEVTGIGAAAATALNPMLPALTAVEPVVGEFEKIIESLCGVD